jgi:predicted RNase H-like HicB family nuclease
MDILMKDDIDSYKENEIICREKVFIEAVQETRTYIIYRDQNYFTAQCLDVNVASFGETIEEARSAIKEALELYYED